MKTTSELSILVRILLRAVRGYQRLASGRPSQCRYVPTCSNYALDALETRGAVRGSVLALSRLARCHPWGGNGWDPVPDDDEHLRRVPIPQAASPRRGDPCST